MSSFLRNASRERVSGTAGNAPVKLLLLASKTERDDMPVREGMVPFSRLSSR